MPVNVVITGIIEYDQLRKEMGDPTLDSSEAGWVSQEMLENIIQRHHDEAVDLAEAMIAQASSEGKSPGPQELFVPIEIPLTASTDLPGVKEGTVPVLYAPYITKAEADERSLDYDDDIYKTLNTDPFALSRKRYQILGRKVYVLPALTTTATCFLALKTKLYDHILSGDLLAMINAKILAAAKTMLAARIAEGKRLEALYEPGDLTLGNQDSG